MNKNNRLPYAATLLAVGLLVNGCNNNAPNGEHTETPSSKQQSAPLVDQLPPDTHLVTLSVDGMHCDACAAGIQKELRSVEGVRDAEVSFAAKTAWVAVDDGSELTEQEVAATITKLGFSTTQPSS
jgi:copper chaperone CopZ